MSSSMRICATSSDRPQLWRHGRDRRCRPRARQGQAAHLYRRLRSRDGQSLLDLNELARRGCRNWRRPATAGACRRTRRRRIPRPPTSNGSTRAASTCRSNASRAGSSSGWPADPAAQLHLRDAHHAGRYVGRFAKMTKADPAWSYYEIDASHSPNVTAPDALMALLQKSSRNLVARMSAAKCGVSPRLIPS